MGLTEKWANKAQVTPTPEIQLFGRPVINNDHETRKVKSESDLSQSGKWTLPCVGHQADWLESDLTHWTMGEVTKMFVHNILIDKIFLAEICQFWFKSDMIFFRMIQLTKS